MDYAADIRKYTTEINEGALAAIEKFLSIAMRNPDSALVSTSDGKELATVRDGFAAKKLGLAPDAADAGLKAVAEKMKGGPAEEPGHLLLPARRGDRHAGQADLTLADAAIATACGRDRVTAAGGASTHRLRSPSRGQASIGDFGQRTPHGIVHTAGPPRVRSASFSRAASNLAARGPATDRADPPHSSQT